MTNYLIYNIKDRIIKIEIKLKWKLIIWTTTSITSIRYQRMLNCMSNKKSFWNQVSNIAVWLSTSTVKVNQSMQKLRCVFGCKRRIYSRNQAIMIKQLNLSMKIRIPWQSNATKLIIQSNTIIRNLYVLTLQIKQSTKRWWWKGICNAFWMDIT